MKMTIKQQYHLLFGDIYYAQPHLEDYRGHFATKELAETEVVRFLAEQTSDPFWWATIFVVEKNGDLLVIKKWGNDPHTEEEYIDNE